MAGVKKLAFVDKWKVVKSLAEKNMKHYVVQEMKDHKGEKDAVARITAEEKEFKQLYSNFKLGFTPTLKALENAKTPEEQAKYCKDGVKIIGVYEKLIDGFVEKRKKNDHFDYAHTTMILGAMLKRIESDLRKGKSGR